MSAGTVFGPDLSNHNSSVDFAALDGLSDVHLVTHKITEGVGWTDPTVAGRAAALQRFAAPGFYHVLWPTNSQDNPTNQAQWFVAEVARIAPWMLRHPCPVLQGDFELFSNFTPYRAPTITECNQFQDAVAAEWKARGGNPPAQLDYAPYWLYGNTVTGLKHLWWASSYVGGSGDYHALYPGNGDSRWTQIPAQPADILQYSSSASFGAAASGVDANAVRGVSTAAELQSLLLGGDVPLTAQEIQAVADAVWAKQITATIGNNTKQAAGTFLANTNERVSDPSLNIGAVTDADLAANTSKIVGAVNSGRDATIAAVNAARDAVLQYLATHPATADLTDQDKLDIANDVVANLQTHGILLTAYQAPPAPSPTTGSSR